MDGTRFDVGIMVSFRNPAAWRRNFVDVYRDELALIEHAERLGYDTVWLTEHHFADDGYSPSIIPLAGAIAARTSRIRIGFNLLLLPLHHAVAIAEAIATLDVLSGGRIDVGLGQGYARHEFAGYGIDRAERLGRFTEGLDVLEGLWTNERFSYAGVHYRIDDAYLVPKPVQVPMPPVWIGATSVAGVRRAGRRGAHLLGLANRRLQHEYDTARLEVGLDPDAAHVLQLHWTHVGATDDDAWAEAAPHFHHLLEVYAGWLDDAADPGNQAPVTTVPPIGQLRSTRTLFTPVIGSPATVADAIRASSTEIRTTHLALGLLPGLDPARTQASLDRFARQVAPRLG